MRSLRWVPLTFVCGLHGFVIFAPYAVLVLSVFLVVRSRRRARA